MKRAFDLIVSVAAILLTGWLIVLAWLVATVDTRANGFFVQERVGRDGRRFPLIKIRTMRGDATTTVTTAHDPRVTPLGRLFRRVKIDELPQFINVLLGHMSVVGPRPDVPGFADRLSGDERIILKLRPGITGPATLHFRDEERQLALVDDPEAYNRDVIYPMKVRLNKEYAENYSFRGDIALIWRTAVPWARSNRKIR